MGRARRARRRLGPPAGARHRGAAARRTRRSRRALPRSGAPVTRQAALTALANGLGTAGVPLVLVLDDCHLVSGAASLEVLGFLVEHLPEPVRVVLAMRGEPAVPAGSPARPRRAARDPRPRPALHDARGARPAARRLRASISAPPSCSASSSAPRAGRPACAWPGSRCATIPTRGRSCATSPATTATSASTSWRRCCAPSRPRSASSSSARRCRRGCAAASATRCWGARRRPRCSPRWSGATSSWSRSTSTTSWYRYHHLFADFLRGQLVATEPELVPELHRRAAAWLGATVGRQPGDRTTRRPAAPTGRGGADRVARPDLDASRATGDRRGLAQSSCRRATPRPTRSSPPARRGTAG